MKPITMLLAALLLCSPSIADDVTVKFTGLVKGQSYALDYAADGTIAIRPIITVPVGGAPAPTPTPTPTPTPAPNPTLAGAARQFTTAALLEGGSSLTAASLATVYGVVANQVNSGAGALPVASIGPALKALSDAVVPSGEKAIWDKWRANVAMLMAGNLDDKAEAVKTLQAVSDGTKAAVDGAATRTGSPAINWQLILEFLMPILLKLLEKFLNPMAMP